MSWRGLCISSPARLDLRAGRLLLRREGEEDRSEEHTSELQSQR